MFNCALCENEWCYVSKVCAECRRIKHIMNIYSKKEVLGVLERILIRPKENINKSVVKEIDDTTNKKRKCSL